MIILGISDSHESHACVLIDGKIIAAAAEERFTRLKADGGYPKNAIDKVIKQSGIKKQDINLVVFAGHSAGLFHNLMKPVALFSVKDWIFQNEKYWKPLLLNNKKLSLLDDFNLFKKKIKDLKKNPYYSFLKKIKGKEEEDYNEIFNNVRKDTVSKHLGINKNKIFFIRHEECHQYYGYYSQANYKDKVLIFTIEGAGDDSSATVSLGENGFVKEIYKTNLSVFKMEGYDFRNYFGKFKDGGITWIISSIFKFTKIK